MQDDATGFKIDLSARQDLIFFDTEFSSLDPSIGEILSVGMTDLRGRELYLELEHAGEVSDWVKDNILNDLNGPKLSKDEAKKQIKKFVGKKNPYAVAFVDNYDNLYMIKLFGVGGLPFRWLTIDLASILFAMGYEPNAFMIDKPSSRDFFSQLGIDAKKYRAHHALDDARLLRDVWTKLFIDRR